MAASGTNNQIATQEQSKAPQKLSFSQVINSTKYQRLLMNCLCDEKTVKEFTKTIITAVNKTPAIQECTTASIIGAALNGASMNLSPLPQLGQFYLVPFKQKEKKDRAGNIIQPECTKAEFVLGWRGYWQLALRSEKYEKITVLELKEGEIKSWDPLNETIEKIMITDPVARREAKTVGYYAMYKLHDGFTKAMYMSKEEMIDYADTYSPAFSATVYRKIENGEIPQNELWKYSSFWYKNFDAMGKKTMIRQLIGHYGPMSVEIQNAYSNDEQIVEVNDNGELVTMEDSYVDYAQPQVIDVEEQIDLESL